MSRDNVGEIHILIRPPEGEEAKNRVEISTSFSIPELNLVLDEVKYMILSGELSSNGE